MNFELVYARWMLGEFPSERLPDVAADLMVEGHDGPAVYDLASHHEPDRYAVAEPALLALRELGYPAPSHADCVLFLMQDMARDVVDGRVHPLFGLRRLQELLCWNRLEETDERLEGLTFLRYSGEEDMFPQDEGWQMVQTMEACWELLCE